MKKTIVTTTVAWLIILAAIFVALIGIQQETKTTYKISINRIHNQLSIDYEENIFLLNNLPMDELTNIEIIDIIDFDKSENDTINTFFQVENIYKNDVVFMPIENTSMVARYELIPVGDNSINNAIFLSVIITLIYLFSVYRILMIDRNIIKPIERISKITKQIATGYIGEINLQYKNGYVKDFIWSLDMLREQLTYEKDKNSELEKQRKTLVAGLSHDIKTPLSSIKNYTIALKEGVYEKEEDINNALDVILDKTDIIDRLTKELLETSSHAMGDIVVTTKDVYLKDVHQHLNRIIHQKIDLFHIKYNEPVIDENILVEVDLNRLSEVFDNIIENALKYGDMKELSVEYSKEDNYKLIIIKNTGHPIPESEIKHIFTSYYRGSNISDRPGYGLGLFISKQIMKNMNGDIFAMNNDGAVSFVIVIKQAG